jgi:hypothetical protein
MGMRNSTTQQVLGNADALANPHDIMAGGNERGNR